ncbi:MAG: undecaprenyl-phosphate glucose phosphotransferase [Chloroflexi bacterium]|nr:undecaprenyl-phosphate glucose phosphotransferase [Chloroflexota bacterium]
MYRRLRRFRTLFWMLLDILLLNLSFYIAYYGRYELQWLRAVAPENFVPLGEYIPVFVALTVVLLLVYRLEGLYSLPRSATWLDEVYTIALGTLGGVAVWIVIAFIYRPLFYSRLFLVFTIIITTIILSTSRLLGRAIQWRLRARGIGVERILVVGAGEKGRALMQSLLAQPGLGYQVIGFLDDDQNSQVPLGRFPPLGRISDLGRVLKEEGIGQVFITLPADPHERILSIIAQCQEAGVRVRILPDLFEMSLARVKVEEIGGLPLLGVREVSISGWNLTLKRALDFIVATLGLVILLPVAGLIALAIKLESPGPVLFRQRRIGRDGQPFTLYKFRSMKPGAQEELAYLVDLNQAQGIYFKMRDDPRITRVGRFLRRTSLDEFPQLWNVLRGEMSLVGPRPGLPQEVEKYEEWHKKRWEVPPGLTGLWQVMGRSDLSFDEMVMLDLYYIENWSLWMDLKILLLTIPTVLTGRGAY